MCLFSLELASHMYHCFQAEVIFKANPKLLNQFQYCEENQIPLCAVIGESELEKNVVMLRDMAKREQVMFIKKYSKNLRFIIFHELACQNNFANT